MINPLLSFFRLLLFAVLQPVLGLLSDKIGRKPSLAAVGISGTIRTVLLLTALIKIASEVSAFLLMMVGLFDYRKRLYFYLCCCKGRVISGLSTGIGSSLALRTYHSDISGTQSMSPYGLETKDMNLFLLVCNRLCFHFFNCLHNYKRHKTYFFNKEPKQRNFKLYLKVSTNGAQLSLYSYH